VSHSAENFQYGVWPLESHSATRSGR
jgi:hypothetical protein